MSIRIEGLTKSFPLGSGERLTAVDGVSLTIESGATAALTGPSGSGKSTLLHMIGAIEKADAGTIGVDGTVVTALSRRKLAEYRRRVGFVFQRYNLLPALTALDNVLAPVLPLKPDFDAPARARALLSAVGLKGRERSLPSKMSGGQQQRVAIARALINHPPLLLADEPTGNLDSQTGAAILELLLQLRAAHGMSVIIATHDPAIAGRCERAIALRDGRLEFAGARADLH